MPRVTVDSPDPWSSIPLNYNLGLDLTRGQVQRGRGNLLALVWEDAAGQTASFSYQQLDALSNRAASSLARLGVRRGDRVFLRLPNRPEFYVAALAVYAGITGRSPVDNTAVPEGVTVSANVRRKLQLAAWSAAYGLPRRCE